MFSLGWRQSALPFRNSVRVAENWRARDARKLLWRQPTAAAQLRAKLAVHREKQSAAASFPTIQKEMPCPLPPEAQTPNALPNHPGRLRPRFPVTAQPTPSAATAWCD